jgi:uncharacterized protein YkwD
VSIVGQCPSCNRKFNAPDTLLGKPARCPQCGNQFVVQAVSGAIQAAAPPSPNVFEGFGDQPATPRAAAPGRSSGGGKVSMPVVAVALGAGVLVLVLCAGGLVWLLSASGGGQWKEYAPSGGGFSVLLPGSPDQKETSDPKLVSASKIREAAAQSGSKTSYTVQYYDLPDKPINNYLYFSWLKNHLLDDGGKLAFEQDISQGSYAGREVVVDLPDDQVLVRRMYAADNRIYCLTARYSRTASTAEAQKFLDSFKITDKRTALAAAPPPPAVVATALAPKKDVPPATMPAPPQPKLPDATFVRAEEQPYVDLFNRYRAAEKAPALKPVQQLFESARAEALASAEGRPAPPANYGARNVIHMAQPLPKGLSAEQYVEAVFKNPTLRAQLANHSLEEIGVGVATDKNGTIHGVFLLASPLK